jgi:hypothetical protein
VVGRRGGKWESSARTHTRTYAVIPIFSRAFPLPLPLQLEACVQGQRAASFQSCVCECVCWWNVSVCINGRTHTKKPIRRPLLLRIQQGYFFVCILLFLHQHFVLLSGADGLLSVGHNAKIATWLWRAHSGTPSLKKTVVDACVRRRVVLHRPRFTALAEIQSVGRQKKKKNRTKEEREEFGRTRMTSLA